MHSGLIISSSSLYPIKYLIDLFAPYGSLFEINILLTSISSILITFLFLQKSLFFTFLSRKLMFSSLVVICGEKK